MTGLSGREADIQRAVVAALRVALPGAIIHHSPNEHRAGGVAARRVQGIRSGMGLCAGWSDLVVLAQGRVLFLEVKGPRGRLSPAQEAFRERVLAEGHHWALVRSVDEALEAAATAGMVVRARVGGGRT
ncbi:VRR-NUC domain-containing protein [Tabrizicola thermarum]|uniref:VRR-NUC domain-containing protein n=1 Tax=Tabrizicola thermarum TaxID=2670345 RepID=UPI000FFB1DD3|nr:VRR-NUC domain-containing protein [Tabrizicola thermarum]